MGEETGIPWCDHTFNPWIGCCKVSDGCRFCYAEEWGIRFGVKWGSGEERRKTKTWNHPLRWNAKAREDSVRRRVFCASLADVFENNSQLDGWRRELFDLIERCDSLDWLLLSKRPENMNRLTPLSWQHGGWPPHVWALTTVEHQAAANERIPLLRNVPAKVRGISFEPLLGPVEHDLNGIHWTIVGAESGPHRRMFSSNWAYSLLQQSREADAKFFMKQVPEIGGVLSKKGVTDRIDLFPRPLRIREFPRAA